jgi:hypothetical protein
MRRMRISKWLGLTVAGAYLVQITACLGPDPAFLVTTTAVSALVANVVSLLFGAVAGGGLV